MNTYKYIRWSFAAGAAVLGLAASLLGEDAVEKQVRVVVRADEDVPAGENRHIMINYQTDGEEESGPRAFLGVETARVSTTLQEQLGLPRGIGLVVQRVVDESAAATTLKKHDILTKLDDQLLVSADQLGVLVRSKNPGDEVTLTFVRGGKEELAKVKLGETKGGPRVLEFHSKDGRAIKIGAGAGAVRLEGGTKGSAMTLHSELSQDAVGHIMKRIEMSGGKAEGHNFTWVGKGDDAIGASWSTSATSNVVLSDENGTVSLLFKGKSKTLRVADQAGEVVFEGPVDTDEERAALKEEVKARLQKVENIKALESTSGWEVEMEDVRGPELGNESARMELVPAVGGRIAAAEAAL